MTSKQFDFNALSDFIDRHPTSQSAHLLVAIILGHDQETVMFFHPDAMVQESSDYQLNRKIESMRYALKAMSTENLTITHLAIAFLFQLKTNFESVLEWDMYDERSSERIERCVERLGDITFGFRSVENAQKSSLPSIRTMLPPSSMGVWGRGIFASPNGRGAEVEEVVEGSLSGTTYPIG